MHASEALLAVERLVRLTEKGAGSDESVAQEVRVIIERLDRYSSESYFAKRLHSMSRTLATWLSPPNWAPSEKGPDFLQSILDEELKQLRFAVQSAGRVEGKTSLRLLAANSEALERRA